jgi:prolyl 4-hydroxylase
MTEPVTELRRRADAGDAAAQVALGARLMVGDGVALDAEEAGALLARANAQGSPDAAALLATIEAMGAGRRQSWDNAFDFLVLAAERGSESARGQLALLNRDPGAAGDWRRIRVGIDLDALTAAPDKRSLSDAPRIRVIDGFASKAECAWVLERGKGHMHPAMVIDHGTGGEASHPNRTNKALELLVTGMDVVIQVLRARIANATRLPIPVFEPAQIMHYSPGEEFRPHYDFLTPESPGMAAQIARFGQRIATFLLYLNEDFEGGDTEFPMKGISHRGRTGDALFFANIDTEGALDPLTQHAGRPPVSGEKWILSQWIRDRSPGPVE